MPQPRAFTAARRDAGDEAGWLARENPARPHELAGRVRKDTPETVAAAARRAGSAQAAWAERSLRERAAAFDAALARIDGIEALAALLAGESGKPVTECAGEIRFAVALARDMIDRGLRLLEDDGRGTGPGRRVVRRRPHGVVAAIVPWNAPVILSMTKLAPALISGNAVVMKPSPLAPLAVTSFVEMLSAGLPEGLVQVVNGGGEVGAALVDAPETAKIAFTGGPDVGRAVLRRAAERFVPCVMELGGNDPLVVLDDLDLTPDRLERIVWASFLNVGQVCMAAKRLLLPEGIVGRFTEGYVETARRLFRLGDPQDDATNMGPVISRGAQQRIEVLAEGSTRSGGRVIDLLSDGAPLPDTGYFVMPRLVTGLGADAPLVREEQFGPIVPVVTYRSEAEMLDLAAGGGAMLSASVWSGDPERAWALVERIGAGLCLVNAHNRSGFSFDLPFGGSGASGYGREYADEGLIEYSVPQALHRPNGAADGSRYPGSA